MRTALALATLTFAATTFAATVSALGASAAPTRAATHAETPTPASSPSPTPSPTAFRYWQCGSKLGGKVVSGRVCARNEPEAVDECGATVCNLDLVCQGQCACTPTLDACAPLRP